MNDFKEQHMYVGTYAENGLPSLYVYALNMATGNLSYLSDDATSANPSFLAINPARNHLYAVSEMETFRGQPGGSVIAFNINPHTYSLSQLNQQATLGAAPCHLALDASQSYLLVANYMGGNVNLFAVHFDGTIGIMLDNIQHVGHGIRPDRQEAPHPHSVTFDPTGQYALVADLGLDKLFIYTIDATRHKLITHAEIAVQPGDGPRHAVFHPTRPHVYVINELASTVSLFSFEPSMHTLQLIQNISTLPTHFQGESTCAEICLSPSGSFLYGSNRGDDSIVIYAIHPDSGKLTYVDHAPTLGKTPRNFILSPDGRFLFVANQDSNSLVSYTVDQQTGKLTPTGQIVQVPQPVCLKILSNR